MKNIAIFFIAYNLLLCACTVPQINKNVIKNNAPMDIPQINKNAIKNNAPMNIPLVLFFEEKTENNQLVWDYGYANSETLEIIIKRQYHRAEIFTGNFAVVQKKEEGKYSIINKKNIEVMKNFDYAFLYQLDNGTVLALILSFQEGQIPGYITYKLYNLNNGDLLKVDKSKNPEITIIDNYIMYGNFPEYIDIYEIGANGKLKKIDITVEDFFTKIIREKNLQYRENNFYSVVSDESYSYYSYRELHYKLKFGYFDSLDINEVIKNVPDNMTLKTYDSYNETKYYINIINWDKTYPFKKKNYLYRIKLVSYESGKEEEYCGLYDSSDNLWVIPPLEGNGNFYIIDDNWVAYFWLLDDNFYCYNIKTKERHEAQLPGSRYFSLYFHD